jgi:hypothetical protein
MPSFFLVITFEVGVYVEDFLRRNHLPAMDDSPLMALLPNLEPADRADAEAYVESVTEKAMAVSKAGTGLFWRYGTRSLKRAGQLALGTCREATGQTCHLIAENMTLLKGWQDNLPPMRN